MYIISYLWTIDSMNLNYIKSSLAYLSSTIQTSLPSDQKVTCPCHNKAENITKLPLNNNQYSNSSMMT